MTLTTLTDLERAGRWIHRSNVVGVHQFLPTTEVGTVENGTMLHVLCQEGNCILSAVRFHIRQIHVVYEEHHLLSHGRSVVRSGSLVDVAFHLPLQGARGTVVRHDNALGHDGIGFLIETGQIVLDDLGLASAGVAHQHGIPTIPHQPVQQIRHPRRIDRFYEQAVEGHLTWTIPDRSWDMPLHFRPPVDVTIGFHVEKVFEAS